MPQPNRRTAAYPRFSAEEYARREAAARELMDEADVSALVVYGHSGSQANIRYLANYAGGHHNYLVVFADPAESPLLLIGLNNLRQYALETATVEDVRYGGTDPAGAVVDRLEGAGVEAAGVVGLNARFDNSLPHGHYETLRRSIDRIEDVTGRFGRLQTVHSAEELAWVRRGTHFTDLAMAALVEAVAPGTPEYELQGRLEAAYLPEGGDRLISFLSSAPMTGAEPGEAFPWKRRASERRLEAGDVVTTELSATYWGYAGQIHRPIAVDAEPTPTYRELYDRCETAYHDILDALGPGATAREVHDAMGALEEMPHSIQDVVVHGFGYSYGPPFIGTTDSNYWPGADEPTTADWTFEAGMVVVVQPTAFTDDERQGVQLGNTVLITDEGTEVLQAYPLEFVRA